MDEELGSDQESQRAIRHQRGEMRDSMLLHAVMRLTAEGPAVALRVRNLSAGGLMAECSAMVEQGQSVEVELRNVGTVGGKIAWVRGQHIGIAFGSRIDPRVARKPVGTHKSDSMLVKAPVDRSRRPGLRIE